jgi:hypothetical protein
MSGVANGGIVDRERAAGDPVVIVCNWDLTGKMARVFGGK